MISLRHGAIVALLSLSSLASSCLTVADDEAPILSVELYWDEKPGSGFVGGTCETAGVDRMEWTLLDADDRKVDSNVGRRGASDLCYNAIDFLDLEAGTYRLEIVGYDEDDEQRWMETSGELKVLRFDVSYRFDIPED